MTIAYLIHIQYTIGGILMDLMKEKNVTICFAAQWTGMTYTQEELIATTSYHEENIERINLKEETRWICA